MWLGRRPRVSISHVGGHGEWRGLGGDLMWGVATMEASRRTLWAGGAIVSSASVRGTPSSTNSQMGLSQQGGFWGCADPEGPQHQQHQADRGRHVPQYRE